MMNPVDIGSLMESGNSRLYLKFLVFLTALAVIFDGADIQLLAVAIPTLMKDWILPRVAFANVVAAGLVGMMIGGALAGMAGDRLGRKVALHLSVLLFAVATLAMARRKGFFPWASCASWRESVWVERCRMPLRWWPSLFPDAKEPSR